MSKVMRFRDRLSLDAVNTGDRPTRHLSSPFGPAHHACRASWTYGNAGAKTHDQPQVAHSVIPGGFYGRGGRI